MLRPRFPPRARTPDRRATPWFPSPAESLHRDPALCVVVGLGAAGRAVIARARALVPAGRSVLLADTDTADAWNAALKQATRPTTDAIAPACSGEVAVVLVGAARDVATGAPSIERVRDGCSADRVSAVSLELLGEEPDSRAVPLLGRFQLPSRYEHAVLAPSEVLDLASRLLAAGTATELVRVAVTHRTAGVFAVGASAGWLPHGRVGRLLAAYMLSELAAEICPRAGAFTDTDVPSLMPGIPLTARLRALLTHEATGWVTRLATAWRDRPITGLDTEDHPGRKQLERAVAGWVGEVAATVRGVLTRTLADPTQFRATVFSVTRAIEQLDAERGSVAEQESRLADERRVAAGAAGAVDADRCAAPRGLRPWRLVHRWSLTRQTRRTLREFLAVRTEELVARYQRLALSSLRKELEALAARLEIVADRASRARESFAAMLRAPYPNLIAQQDPETLELVLRELAEPLVRAIGHPATREAWRRAVPALLAGTDEDPWQTIVREATAVAARSPAASRSVAEQCRGLFPLHRPGMLIELLTKLATTRGEGGVDAPDATRVVLIENRDRTAPVVLELRWLDRVQE